MASRGPFYPQGVYHCEIIEQAIGEAKTGTVQVIVKVKVLGPVTPDGGYSPASQQFDRTIYMAVTEKTMPYLVENLKLAGYTRPELSPLDPDHPAHVSLVGNTLDCYCQWERGQDGQEREKWQFSRGSAGIQAKPTTTAKLRALDSLFGRSMRGAGGPPLAAAAAARGGRAVQVDEITDDDIPF